MALRNGRRWREWGALALVALCASGSSQLLADEYPVLAEWTQGKKFAVETPSTDVNLNGMVLLVSNEEDPASGYWIGFYPRILSAEEEQQLGENEPRGVVVNRVLPNSPAAKAKLAEGDIIVGAGDQEINFLDELSQIVQNSAGEPVQLDVIRDGQVMQVEVTPAPRSQRRKMLFWRERGEEQQVPGEQGEAREKLEGMLRKLREQQQAAANKDQAPQERANSEKGGLGLVQRPQFPMPGAPMTRPGMTRAMVMPGGMPMPSGLPDDMQVTIQKRGNKPAKVTVKQGDKLWQTTEHELGMLPPQALRYVFHMLGRPMMPGMGGFPLPLPPVAGQPQRFQFRIGEGGEKSGEQGNVKWFELRQPESAEGPSGQNARDIKIFQLQEQVQKLRRQLEERNSEQPRLQKKGKNRDKKERKEDNEND